MNTPDPAPATVTDATAWKGEDIRHDDSWKYTLSASDLAELEAARQAVDLAGLRWGEFTREEFPLPTFSERLSLVDEQIRNGRGFMLLRGFPVERYTLDQMKTIYWGLGVHMGHVISHNAAGGTWHPSPISACSPSTRTGGTTPPPS